MKNHNKLMELILIYYPNLKHFAKACYNRLSPKQQFVWCSQQNLYVRLRDNLIGNSKTIFDKKINEPRNQDLHFVIARLLFISTPKVVKLANQKTDKVKQIRNLQDKIDAAERQFEECNVDDQRQQINILLEMIQHLNEIVYLK
tara:strand:+ start:110 stop:541 length:432 start_codon:yes stop_codon:yes gene_type:complete